MSNRKIRQLLKSKATMPDGRSARATRSLIGPDPAQGSSGDIEVRQTNFGPKLFAKVGAQWYVSDLKPLGQPETEIKIHYFTGILPAATNATIPINPSIVPYGSIVGINFFCNHSGTFWHIYNWADISDDSASSAETGPYVTRHRVLYHSGDHAIYMDRRGTQIDDAKPYKVLIFYV